VLFLGSYPFESADTSKIFKRGPLLDEEFTKVKIGTLTKGNYWDVVSANTDGVFDFKSMNIQFKENAIVYLSFWMYSPRSLTDLLIEPNMPRLDMHFGVDDALSFNINGKVVKEYIRQGVFLENQFTYEGVPLEKGWNHVLIKVGQSGNDWLTKIRFSSTKPAFLKKLKTTVDH